MVLLDTQAAIWWLLDDPRLTSDGISAIERAGNQTAVSAASVWELEIKRAKGKFNGPSLIELLPAAGIGLIDITPQHAQQAAHLPAHHADPFDRMIVAQAMLERRTLVTSDVALRAYDVRIAW
jgi:PIN domain nuclease of toxin-antitoxin system